MKKKPIAHHSIDHPYDKNFDKPQSPSTGEFKIGKELFPDGEKNVEYHHPIESPLDAKSASATWFQRFYLILRILKTQDEYADSSQSQYHARNKKKGKTRTLRSDTENLIPHAIQIETIGKRLYKDEPNKKKSDGQVPSKYITPILVDMFEYDLIETWQVSGHGKLFYKILKKGKDALLIIEGDEIQDFHESYPTPDDHPLKVLFEKLQSN